MDVTLEGLLYLAAGLDVVHVGIDDGLEHHPGMIGTAAAFLVQLPEIFKIQRVNDSIYYAYRVVFGNIFVNPLRKQYRLVVYVRAKV